MRDEDLQSAYDRLAPVWAETTDDGPFNAHFERPALRSLVPRPLTGVAVLDAGCAAGTNCRWLLDEGASVAGVDLSLAMVEETARRCGGRGRFLQADLAQPLALEADAFDGVICSLTLHYLDDWSTPLASFARVLRLGGWLVVSVDHPFGAPFPGEEGTYFDTRLVHDEMTKGDVTVPISLWRRSLTTSFDEFGRAGFVVETVVEPRPSPEAVDRFPAELGPVVDQPWFILYRMRLAPALATEGRDPGGGSADGGRGS